MHHNSTVSSTSFSGLETVTVLTSRTYCMPGNRWIHSGWIEAIMFFLRNILKAATPLILGGIVWLELKVGLKTNRYENEVARLDCTMTLVTSLFNWQAISITDQLGNTIVSSVIKLVMCIWKQSRCQMKYLPVHAVYYTKWYKASNFVYHHKIWFRVYSHNSCAHCKRLNQGIGQIKILTRQVKGSLN